MAVAQQTREQLVAEKLPSITADQLATRCRRAIEMHVQGAKNTEIAALLNCTSATVAKMLDNPIAKAHIAELNNQIQTAAVESATKLVQLTPKAVNILEQAIDGKILIPNEFDPISGAPAYQVVGPEKRIDTAQDVLDRSAPTAKVSKSQSVPQSNLIDQEAIERVRERYRTAMGLGPTIDAEFSIPEDTVDEDIDATEESQQAGVPSEGQYSSSGDEDSPSTGDM